MREILFRGKRRDTGEWVEGSLQCFKGFSIFEPHVWKNYFTVDPATVGQYTGLNDKNGKRIFEGDVVQKHSVPMEVVFDAESAQFIVRYELDGHEHCFENTLCGHDLLTVIGNIHDNPELVGR